MGGVADDADFQTLQREVETLRQQLENLPRRGEAMDYKWLQERFDNLRSDAQSQFRWIVGTGITLALVVAGTIFGLGQRVASLDTSVEDLSASVKNLSSLEMTVAKLDTSVGTLSTSVSKLGGAVDTLAAKVSYLEGKSDTRLGTP